MTTQRVAQFISLIRRAGLRRRLIAAVSLLLLATLLSPLVFAVAVVLSVGSSGSRTAQADLYMSADGALLAPLMVPTGGRKVGVQLKAHQIYDWLGQPMLSIVRYTVRYGHEHLSATVVRAKFFSEVRQLMPVEEAVLLKTTDSTLEIGNSILIVNYHRIWRSRSTVPFVAVLALWLVVLRMSLGLTLLSDRFKRAARVFGGRCPICKYPLMNSRCTECGHVLTEWEAGLRPSGG